jgi:uncharacterized protein
MNRYFALSNSLRRRYGCGVRKIPLDCGATCPNRDGTLSTSGCLFCSPAGSGTGLWRKGASLDAQWDHFREKIGRRHGNVLFWAYLQSFSNTHGPAVKLRDTLVRICALPGISGLAIGTRPDCVDEEKLALIAGAPLPEVWLELGLQSHSDATLKRINRGHRADDFSRAVGLAAATRLNICVHVMAGLPGEGEEDFLRTIEFVNAHPVHGVKLHNLFVCKGSSLMHEWELGRYEPLSMEGYVQTVLRALTILRPDIVVHRLNADPGPGELVAPDWALQKAVLLKAIRSGLEAGDLWQGKACGASGVIPEWFGPPQKECARHDKETSPKHRNS